MSVIMLALERPKVREHLDNICSKETFFTFSLLVQVLLSSTRFQYRPEHKKVKLMLNEISNQDQDTLECLF